MALSKIPAAGFSDAVNFRNIIINGDMTMCQRGNSETGITASGYYTLDRFQTLLNTAGTWTQSQSTTVPSSQGFAKSLKMDCTTADASLGSGDYLIVQQKFEGQMLQYLKKGTSSAESLTASFWVRSNKTGTYIAELRDRDNDRTISQSYTISAADTWENKTVTFAGDTSDAFDDDNVGSLDLNFWLAAGSTYSSGTLQTSWGSRVQANRAVGQVNIADSTSNEWYITGIQLEAGTTASDFEFIPKDVNSARCHRYYQNSYRTEQGIYPNGVTNDDDDGIYECTWQDGNCSGPTLKCEMRTAPTMTYRGYSSSTTGQVDQSGTTRSANSTHVSSKQVSHVSITSGASAQWAHYRHEADAEL